MASANPKQVTIYGRLSFPSFTAAEAYALSQKGSYPSADVASTAPHFQLLVTEGQWDKFREHCVKEFLPYCGQQHTKGEKKDALDPKEVKALIEALEGELGDSPYNTPAKPVHEKTIELAPEAIAAIKVMGSKGSDIELKAIVQNENELSVPDPDLLTFPVVKPIGQTVHSMYAGCYVAATLNLYSYHNGKLPGFSASSNIAVFKADGERFGGSVGIDEDEIFLD